MRLRIWVVFLSVVCGYCIAFPIVPLHAAVETVPEALTPQLEVPIPGVQFSQVPVQKENGLLYESFLPVYINGVYLFLLGIVVIAAAVMVVYGGFKYIIAATGADIQDGKDRIRDAILGLVLVFASYGLLKMLNPSFGVLKPIVVDAIDPVAYTLITNSMSTTQPTSLPPSSEGGGASEVSQGAPAGGCPFSLPPSTGNMTGDKQRNIQFFQKVKPMLTGRYVERVQKAGELAVQCGMLFGPCGVDIATIWTLAGVGDATCLEKNGFCSPPLKTLQQLIKNPVLPVNQSSLWGLACKNDCAQKKGAQADKANRADCVDSRQGAVAKARGMLSAGADGYPDKYADLLQPGDWIYDYNANMDCAGTHSVLFLGWKDTKGMATVVGGDITHPMHASQVCLKTTCGNWLPLVLINRPDPAKVQ